MDLNDIIKEFRTDLSVVMAGVENTSDVALLELAIVKIYLSAAEKQMVMSFDNETKRIIDNFVKSGDGLEDIKFVKTPLVLVGPGWIGHKYSNEIK